jgi:hypothetical protein
MSTWRQHNFQEGAKYRVKKAIVTPTSDFSLGEIVVFCGSSYSHYDSSSAFMFQAEPSGENKTWFLHDDDDDHSNEIFECA